jgi:diguanylate cyclase (GGDEF)-like protein
VPSREKDDVFKILVSELAHTIMPTTVMGVTIVVVGLFAYSQLGNVGFLLGVVSGGIASVAKVLLMIAHQRFNATARVTVEAAAIWEKRHAILTFIVAGSIAWLASLMFLHRDLSVHMLATALLFGYCAGVSTRVAVRPYIAAPTITIAAVPSIIGAALNGGWAHWVLTMVFVIFLLAAMQSVWHMYSLSTRQIYSRLEMEHQARHDSLTGLRNRVALAEAFGAMGRKDDALAALHCFDLDGFKTVNDRFGHVAGDELLAAIGKRLQDLQGQAAIPFRLGGDEFVVLQTAMNDPGQAESLAATIVTSLSMPYIISGKPITIGISLGYTIAPSATADLSSMMRLADAASYRVKRQGGGIDREVPPAPERDTISSAA